jgi:hypothetical protein
VHLVGSIVLKCSFCNFYTPCKVTYDKDRTVNYVGVCSAFTCIKFRSNWTKSRTAWWTWGGGLGATGGGGMGRMFRCCDKNVWPVSRSVLVFLVLRIVQREVHCHLAANLQVDRNCNYNTIDAGCSEFFSIPHKYGSLRDWQLCETQPSGFPFDCQIISFLDGIT